MCSKRNSTRGSSGLRVNRHDEKAMLPDVAGIAAFPDGNEALTQPGER
jgi:hypothetical protein